MGRMSELHAYQQENPELGTLEEVVSSYKASRAPLEGKHRATIEFPQSVWERINSVAHEYQMPSSEFIRLCVADAVSPKTMYEITWIKQKAYEEIAIESAIEEQRIVDRFGKSVV